MTHIIEDLQLEVLALIKDKKALNMFCTSWDFRDYNKILRYNTKLYSQTLVRGDTVETLASKYGRFEVKYSVSREVILLTHENIDYYIAIIDNQGFIRTIALKIQNKKDY